MYALFLSAKPAVCYAVASPFDVKNGRGQIPGVSQVGHSHNGSTGSLSDSDTYNIKFTFAASPHAKAEGSPVRDLYDHATRVLYILWMDNPCTTKHRSTLQRCFQLARMLDSHLTSASSHAHVHVHVVITCLLMGIESALESCCKLCTQ